MTSQRMQRRLSNRRPHWMAKAQKAQESAFAGVAGQYDRTRYCIRKTPVTAEREEHLRALVATLRAFNIRMGFLDPDDPDPMAGHRVGHGERAFKARHVLVEAVDVQYDYARQCLHGIRDTRKQETHLRELEEELRKFNDRFTRQPARA